MTRFNPLRFSASALALAAVATFSVGCDSGTSGTGKTPPANHGGGHGEHGHGEHALGTVEIEGRSVTVLLDGELKANEPYPHTHLTITGEPVETMRVWIGNEQGDSTVKGAVEGLGSHPAVNLEAPADLDGAGIGVEIVVDGQTLTAFEPISHDHDDDDHGHGEHEEGEGHDNHDHDGDGVPDH